MKKLFRIASLSALTASLSAPLLAVAQTGINTTRIGQYSTGIVGVINNILVPVLMAIAFIVFLWGVYKYFILGATEEKSREDGRKFTLWGIIGFVVILSLWAFVNLLRGTFGLDNNATAPPPPTIWGTPSGVNANNQSAQNSPFGGGGGGGGGGGSQTQWGQGGQPYVWGGQQATQYTSMQSTCDQYGNTSSQCQQAQNAYLQNYNPAYAPTGSCPAGCSPGTNPNQCVDAGGEPCAGGGGGATQYDANGAPICISPQIPSPEGGCYTPTLNSGGGSSDFVGDIPVDNPGCMEPNAENYGGPSITRDDGSCTYAIDVP